MTSVPTLTAERRALATQFIPLANRVVRPFLDTYPEHYDDLRAEALTALTLCAAEYLPERGVHFATYARPRILGAVVDELRRLFRREERHAAVEWLEQVVDERPDESERSDAAARFEALVAQAPKKYRALLLGYYGRGLRQYELAEELGCSRSLISKNLSDALACLLGCLADEAPIAAYRPRRNRQVNKPHFARARTA